MKRRMAMTLALLLLFACGTALADTYYWDGYATQWGAYYTQPLLPLSDFDALRQSLREAGRYTVAQEVYVLDHTGNRVLSIVARDDSSQLTILHSTTTPQDGRCTNRRAAPFPGMRGTHCIAWIRIRSMRAIIPWN